MARLAHVLIGIGLLLFFGGLAALFVLDIWGMVVGILLALAGGALTTAGLFLWALRAPNQGDLDSENIFLSNYVNFPRSAVFLFAGLIALSIVLGSLVSTYLAGAVWTVAVGLLFWSSITRSWKLQKQRRQACAAVAARMAFAYAEEELAQPALAVDAHFSFFHHGMFLGYHNILRGELNGVAVLLFDCVCAESRGAGIAVTVAVSSQPVELPTFLLRPRHLADVVVGYLRMIALTFPEVPEFSEKFVLRSPSEELARKVFSQEVLRAILNLQGWVVECRNGQLAVYRENALIPPVEWEKLATVLVEVRRLLLPT